MEKDWVEAVWLMASRWMKLAAGPGRLHSRAARGGIAGPAVARVREGCSPELPLGAGRRGAAPSPRSS